jgi:hypothetical protein
LSFNVAVRVVDPPLWMVKLEGEMEIVVVDLGTKFGT